MTGAQLGAAMRAGRAVHGGYRQGWNIFGFTEWRAMRALVNRTRWRRAYLDAIAAEDRWL